MIKRVINRLGNLYRRWVVRPIKALKDTRMNNFELTFWK